MSATAAGARLPRPDIFGHRRQSRRPRPDPDPGRADLWARPKALDERRAATGVTHDPSFDEGWHRLTDPVISRLFGRSMRAKSSRTWRVVRWCARRRLRRWP